MCYIDLSQTCSMSLLCSLSLWRHALCVYCTMETCSMGLLHSLSLWRPLWRHALWVFYTKRHALWVCCSIETCTMGLLLYRDILFVFRHLWRHAVCVYCTMETCSMGLLHSLSLWRPLWRHALWVFYTKRHALWVCCSIETYSMGFLIYGDMLYGLAALRRHVVWVCCVFYFLRRGIVLKDLVAIDAQGKDYLSSEQLNLSKYKLLWTTLSNIHSAQKRMATFQVDTDHMRILRVSTCINCGCN